MEARSESNSGRSNSAENIERIKQAALMVGSEIYTGNTHFDALKALKKVYPQWGITDVKAPKDGFITNRGRFVNRDEAGEIANRAEQIDFKTSSLDSHDIDELRPEGIDT